MPSSIYGSSAASTHLSRSVCGRCRPRDDESGMSGRGGRAESQEGGFISGVLELDCGNDREAACEGIAMRTATLTSCGPERATGSLIKGAESLTLSCMTTLMLATGGGGKGDEGGIGFGSK